MNTKRTEQLFLAIVAKGSQGLILVLFLNGKSSEKATKLMSSTLLCQTNYCVQHISVSTSICIHTQFTYAPEFQVANCGALPTTPVSTCSSNCLVLIDTLADELNDFV